MSGSEAPVSTFTRIEQYGDKWLQPRESTGRPTLATKELATKIVEHLVAGNYLQPACEAAGVSYKTVREWVQKAARDREAGVESPYTEFTDEVTRATAAAETRLVREVSAAPDWRAQAFILERRHRERWGKAEQQQQPQQVLIISDELAKGMLEALQAAARIGDQSGDQSSQVIETTAVTIDTASEGPEKS